MKSFLYIGLLSIVLLTSGCWDRREINDLAFISGTAFDLTKDGEYLLSLQIAIPTSSQGGPGSGGNNQKENFFVISASGINANEAFQKLQKKSSRVLFTAHRSVIFIGESLAKHGINDVLDVFAHDPRQRLKTYIMVVKGGDGREILQKKYPFEQVPMEAIKEMEILGSDIAITLRDFFLASSNEGIYPVMGVIEPDNLTDAIPENKNKLVVLAGSAVFKDLKLAGFLNEHETSGLNWVTNRMRSGRINAMLPDGAGVVGMVLSHTERSLTSEISEDKITFNIKLRGQGSLVENNSTLDFSRPKLLEIAQKALEKSVEKQVRDVLTKLQNRYKADSLGFGQEIYRNKPKQWKTLKNQWETKFPEVEVSIDVKLTINGAGMSGPPLQIKDKEIKK